MILKRIDDLLSQHPFFMGMKEEHIQHVAGCGTNRVVQPGEVLARANDEAKNFFAVREGSLAIEIYDAALGSITVQTVDAGGIVGWSWIIPPHRWQFTIRAREIAKVISFDGLCLRQKCEEDTEMGYQFLKRFSSAAIARLASTRLQLLEIYERRGDESHEDR